MAREYSKVSPRLWGSNRFQDLPDHAHRLAFAYLLTGPQVNSAGCYRIDIRHMALDVELTRATTRQVLDTLYDRLLIGYDGRSDVVLICNWFRFNAPTSGKHAFGTLRQLTDIDSPLRSLAIQALIEECRRREFTLTKAFTDLAATLQASTPIPNAYPIDRVSIPNGKGIAETPGPDGNENHILSIPYRYTETETEGEVEAGAEQIDGAAPASTSGTKDTVGAIRAHARGDPGPTGHDRELRQLGDIAETLERLDNKDPGAGEASPAPGARKLEDALQKREAKARARRQRRRNADTKDG